MSNSISRVRSLTACTLSSGLTQLFAVTGVYNSSLLSTRWETSSSNWTDWVDFPSLPNTQTTNVPVLVAVTLSDQRIQLFATDASTGGSIKIATCWKLTADSHSAWAPWVSFQAPQAPPISLATCTLLDGTRSLFAIDVSGNIQASYNTSPSNPQTDWTVWSSFEGVADGVRQLSSAVLGSGGAPQLFAVDNNKQIQSSWQYPSSSSTPQWTPWSPFTQLPNGNVPVSMASCSLSDLRPQLFAVDESGQIWTSWKTEIASDSEWSPWILFEAMGNSGATMITGANPSDNIPQLFGVDSNLTPWTCQKESTAADASWTTWANFSGASTTADTPSKARSQAT